MVKLTQFVDNRRQSLRDVLREVASDPTYRDLSIVTGYWDMIGTSMLIDLIKDYRSVRILIGAEPYTSRKLHLTNLYDDFPDADIAADLKELGDLPEEKTARYRETARILATMIHEGRLQVRICRKPLIHAKEYVFGSYDTPRAVGIIGSSNFTGRGLSDITAGGNAELNYLEDDERIVTFRPLNDDQQYGHLSWFDMVWNLPDVKDWTGDFQEILSISPVGNATFGPYDVYIKTLMKLFPDELAVTLDNNELAASTTDTLYSYQRRNAGILINKLEKTGTAILADSVGLGKTVTAGSIIAYYRSHGKRNISIIPPAKLKSQWRSDLKEFFDLRENDYSLVSQQDIQAIRRLRSAYRKSYPADLIVVDEAHNLRNEHSERFKEILGLIAENPTAKVLLLTATPINNGFKDLISLLELGLGGRMQSGVIVSYQDPTNAAKPTQSVDFFDFLTLLDGRHKAASRTNTEFNWNAYRQPLAQGISHFVVRSTRQGVREEAQLLHGDKAVDFPDNRFDTIDYMFSKRSAAAVETTVRHHLEAFENIDPLNVDEAAMSDETQRLYHPLDIIHDRPDLCMPSEHQKQSLVKSLFSLITLLGFPAYRSCLYSWDYRNLTLEQLSLIELPDEDMSELRSALTVHNILQTVWLKRLESSLQALKLSVERYQHRLNKFASWVERGYIIHAHALDLVDDSEEESSRLAFWDFSTSDTEHNLDDLHVPYTKADSTNIDVEGLSKDIRRDQNITSILIEALSQCITNDMDSKISSFAQEFTHIVQKNQFGKKILVFSSYADTIDYLQTNLPQLLERYIPDFRKRSAFITASSSNLENTVSRFSPSSKKYTFSNSECELDFLFSTDVLSEGQNLQDAAVLINYDLHWNPVRMVQRNGRINRLGSKFSHVLIGNMSPSEDLEYYLGLLSRLQSKIDTIKNSIGTDQGILTSADENPIEYVQDLYSADESKIQNVLDRVDNENDMLSWRSAHIYELRAFLQHASQSDINRIHTMPTGKWNYLPGSSGLKQSVLTLCEQISDSGIETNYRFVLADVANENAVSSIPDDQALDWLKTSPTDNKRRPDNAQLKRAVIEKRALIMAGMGKSRHASQPFAPKKSETPLLSILQQQLGVTNILKLLRAAQNLVQVRQQYNALMAKAKKEVARTGDPRSCMFSEPLKAEWSVFLDGLAADESAGSGTWRCSMSSMSTDL